MNTALTNQIHRVRALMTNLQDALEDLSTTARRHGEQSLICEADTLRDALLENQDDAPRIFPMDPDAPVD